MNSVSLWVFLISVSYCVFFQFVESRIHDGSTPMIVLTFMCQHVHCIRNAKREIVEGSEVYTLTLTHTHTHTHTLSLSLSLTLLSRLFRVRFALLSTRGLLCATLRMKISIGASRKLASRALLPLFR